jgi:isochorismate hydrolase
MIAFWRGARTPVRITSIPAAVNTAANAAPKDASRSWIRYVTNGLPSKPSGPLYPELLDVIGDQPVIERGGNFNCFLDDAFSAAVRATGRKKLAIAGVSTEGCVLQTVLGALREDYEVFLVVDASASLTKETHDTAVQRMVQAGATPVTWFSLAGEFQVDHRYPTAPFYQQLMREHVPTMRLGTISFLTAQEQARKVAAGFA